MRGDMGPPLSVCNPFRWVDGDSSVVRGTRWRDRATAPRARTRCCFSRNGTRQSHKSLCLRQQTFRASESGRDGLRNGFPFPPRCGVQQHSSLDPLPPLRAGLAIAAVPLRAVRPGRPRTRCENLPLVGPKVPHTGSDRNAQNRLTPAFADVFFTQPSLRYSTVLAAAPKTPRPLVRRSAHTAPRFTTERSPGTEVRIDYDRCGEARRL